MCTKSRESALDHAVVVMFEDRSFDNLLGRLYEPGGRPFERGIGKQLPNRVSDWAEHPAGGRDRLPRRSGEYELAESRFG
jgi:phospholipase C